MSNKKLSGRHPYKEIGELYWRCAVCEQQIENFMGHNCPKRNYCEEHSEYAEFCKDKHSRKDSPVFSGVLQYFPDAIMEIAKHSKKGNDKHNPGQPLHWSKDKSPDHADCVARHLIDVGPTWDALDAETGSYHATALAWRSLALLQIMLERKKAK